MIEKRKADSGEGVCSVCSLLPSFPRSNRVHYFCDIWFQGDDGRFGVVDYRGGRAPRAWTGRQAAARGLGCAPPAPMHAGIHGTIAFVPPCLCWRTYTHRAVDAAGTLARTVKFAPRTIRDSWQIAKDSAGGADCGRWEEPDAGAEGSPTKQCNKWTSNGARAMANLRTFLHP